MFVDEAHPGLPDLGPVVAPFTNTPLQSLSSLKIVALDSSDRIYQEIKSTPTLYITPLKP